MVHCQPLELLGSHEEEKKQFQVTEQCLVTSADPPSRVLLQGWLARVQAKLLIVVHGVLVSRSLNCTNSNSKC